ncbi:MAG: carboxypeptidase regulatory-like domain-containing protein [Bacteroidetes bacterium]|nr:carboxypeptidase regulatory-like domain-containing protein [Bacteroidota bacterium]
MQDPIGNISIKVIVTDSAGVALVGASVSLSPTVVGGSGVTDKEGKCNMIVVSNTYTVNVSMPGFVSQSGLPVNSNGEVPCSLSPNSGNGVINATVSASTGGVIAGATVTATPSSGTANTGTTNTNGIAAISVVAGSYGVVASMTGFTNSASQTALVPSGGSVSLSFSLVAKPN